MKNTIIAGAAAIALAAPAYAELEGDLSLTYNSQFNYRGVNDILQDITSGAPVGVDDTFDAEINVSYSLSDQWALVAGANVNTVSGDGVGNHNRYRGGVRYSAENYSLELGVQVQDLRSLAFGGSNIDSTEVYLNASTTCPLSGGTINLFLANDNDQLSGTYAELSLSKGWELSECVSIEATLGVSYSFDYWDELFGTGSDWGHGYLTIALPWGATENLTVTPFVTFSDGYGALDVGGGITEDSEVVYGISASVNF